MPKTLIITFKRFITKDLAVLKGSSKKYNKNNSLITFPIESFKMNSYIPCKYELFSVTNHSGSLEGGHYYTTVKNMGKWVGVDDLSIYPSEEYENIVIPEAYMLYFRKK